MAYLSSSGFYSEDFRTVLEGSRISDRFWLLFSQSGVLSCGFPWSCAWTSSLAKSRDVVSHGHMLRSWFVKGDERSLSQYSLFRFVAPAMNDYLEVLPWWGIVGGIAGLVRQHVSFRRPVARNFQRLDILAI